MVDDPGFVLGEDTFASCIDKLRHGEEAGVAKAFKEMCFAGFGRQERDREFSFMGVLDKSIIGHLDSNGLEGSSLVADAGGANRKEVSCAGCIDCDIVGWFVFRVRWFGI